MSGFEGWLHEQLAPWLRGCPRCGWLRSWFPDGRCSLCGMDPREHGPAPRRLLQGIAL